MGTGSYWGLPAGTDGPFRAGTEEYGACILGLCATVRGGMTLVN